MSAKATNAVFRLSPAKGSQLLALLVIADEARDDGVAEALELETIAYKTRLSRSQVIRITQALVAKEMLEVRHAIGRGRKNSYALLGIGLESKRSQDATLSPEALKESQDATVSAGQKGRIKGRIKGRTGARPYKEEAFKAGKAFPPEVPSEPSAPSSNEIPHYPRTAVRSIACPACNAPPSEKCRGVQGAYERESNHLERVGAYHKHRTTADGLVNAAQRADSAIEFGRRRSSWDVDLFDAELEQHFTDPDLRKCAREAYQEARA